MCNRTSSTNTLASTDRMASPSPASSSAWKLRWRPRPSTTASRGSSGSATAGSTSSPQLRRGSDGLESNLTIVLLSTDGDTPEHWLNAGQALQRVLLVATMRGLAATPMSQPLENPALREVLSDVPAGRWPQVILRLGYAAPTTPSHRRPLTDVLVAGL